MSVDNDGLVEGVGSSRDQMRALWSYKPDQAPAMPVSQAAVELRAKAARLGGEASVVEDAEHLVLAAGRYDLRAAVTVTALDGKVLHQFGAIGPAKQPSPSPVWLLSQQYADSGPALVSFKDGTGAGVVIGRPFEMRKLLNETIGDVPPYLPDGRSFFDAVNGIHNAVFGLPAVRRIRRGDESNPDSLIDRHDALDMISSFRDGMPKDAAPQTGVEISEVNGKLGSYNHFTDEFLAGNPTLSQRIDFVIECERVHAADSAWTLWQKQTDAKRDARTNREVAEETLREVAADKHAKTEDRVTAAHDLAYLTRDPSAHQVGDSFDVRVAEIVPHLTAALRDGVPLWLEVDGRFVALGSDDDIVRMAKKQGGDLLDAGAAGADPSVVDAAPEATIVADLQVKKAQPRAPRNEQDAIDYPTPHPHAFRRNADNVLCWAWFGEGDRIFIVDHETGVGGTLDRAKNLLTRYTQLTAG